MHKIRPKKILEGWSKAVVSAATGDKSEEASSRISMCNSCENLTKIRTCNLCGCQVDAKVEVNTEYCPINNWEDIKVVPSLGIAVKNLSSENITLSLAGERVYVNFKQTQKQNVPVEVNLLLINDRANFFEENQTLTKLVLTATCGCTVLNQIKETLPDGEATEIKAQYNNVALGVFSKTFIIKSNEIEFRITLKGKTE
jgi:hypothetical protein